MATLAQRLPGDTFQFLLNIDSTNGLDGAIRPVQDGEGTAAPFSLSTGTFQFNAGVAVAAGAGATMDFANITPSNLPTWTKLAQTSPTSGSSFQVTGIPASAVAVLILFSKMDYSANARIEVEVMDDSVVQTSGYFCSSLLYDNTTTTSVAVTEINLHMIRISNNDGVEEQSGQGFLTKNGTTGVWTWSCISRLDDTVTPANFGIAIATGRTPVISGVMNGLEFGTSTGTFSAGTVTVYYQEE